MSVLVYGLNYRTTPINVLERVAVAPEELPKALASLARRTHVAEAVILSTCNRVEAYLHVTRYHGGVADARDSFAEWAGLAPEDLDGSYDYFDERAAAHLFAVTCGLDSMVLGERQIHLQVKEAFARSEAEGTAGRTLQALFQRALRVGKRARSETGIAAGGASMVDVGLAAAEQSLGDLTGRTALLVGAGKMGGMAATRLAGRVGRLLVANRGSGRRERLAARVGAETLDLRDLPSALAEADFVLCSTGAPEQVVSARDVATAMRRRPERPLALVDLAVPRDVDPACRDIPGVTVLDVQAVRRLTDRGEAGTEAAAARLLVEEEVQRFVAWSRASAVEPTIAALRQRAEDVRRAELERLAARLSTLGERERAAVEALTSGIVNTLLHEPTVRLKDIAGARGDEHYAEALRELFDLPAGDE